MRWTKGLIVCLLFAAFAVPALAEERVDEVTEAKNQLNRLIELLDAMEEFIERPKRGRLYVLRSASQSVLHIIETQRYSHSWQEYQKHVVTYRFSKAYFEGAAPIIQPLIKELDDISKQIEDDQGFNKSPYSQITLGVYQQMRHLIESLLLEALEEEFRMKLVGVLPKIGATIAKAEAKEGDRPSVAPVAEQAYRAVESLYDDLYNSKFSNALEIQSLNELYAEYAEIQPSAE